MSKKTLITGATGSLGGAVYRYLKDMDVENLAVMCRNLEADNAKAYMSSGVDVVQGDYNDPASLTVAFEDAETVYIVPASDIQASLQQHRNLMEAIAASNVRNVICTSLVHKDATPDSILYPVMQSLVETEEKLKALNVDFVILRNNIYMDALPLIIGEKEQLLQTKTIFTPTGNGRCFYVLRDELAEATAKVIHSFEEHKNQTYNLNGREALSVGDIAKMYSEIVGVDVSHVSPSVAEFEQTLRSDGVPEEAVHEASMFAQGIALGEFHNVDKDLESILGREPQSAASYLTKLLNA